MSYKHTVAMTVILKLETEDRLDPDELEQMIEELDYSFESDYGHVVTTLEEHEIVTINRSV